MCQDQQNMSLAQCSWDTPVHPVPPMCVVILPCLGEGELDTWLCYLHNLLAGNHPGEITNAWNTGKVLIRPCGSSHAGEQPCRDPGSAHCRNPSVGTTKWFWPFAMEKPQFCIRSHNLWSARFEIGVSCHGTKFEPLSTWRWWHPGVAPKLNCPVTLF